MLKKFRPTHRSIRKPVSGLVVLALTGLLGSSPLLADGPPQLKSAAIGPMTFDLEAPTSAMQLWRILGKVYGFDVVFAPGTKDRELDIEDLSAETVGLSLDRLALASEQLWVALDEDSILVAADTPQNRREFEPQVVRTFHLENAELKNVMTAVRSLYGLKHVVADESNRSLTIRDTDAKVRLTESLLANIDVPADQVAVDVHLAAGSDGDAQTLIDSDLSIVGGSKAKLAIKERHPESGDLLIVELEIRAQTHPSSGEVTLAVESEIAEMDRRTEAAQNKGELSPESQAMSSTWRITSGEPLVVKLPGSYGPDHRPLTLTLTPTTRHASDSGARTAIWVGSESRIEARVAKSKLSDKEKEEIRDRLRARLKALPSEDGSKKNVSAEEREEIRERLRERLKSNQVVTTSEEEEE